MYVHVMFFVRIFCWCKIIFASLFYCSKIVFGPAVTCFGFGSSMLFFCFNWLKTLFWFFRILYSDCYMFRVWAVETFSVWRIKIAEAKNIKRVFFCLFGSVMSCVLTVWCVVVCFVVTRFALFRIFWLPLILILKIMLLFFQM